MFDEFLTFVSLNFSLLPTKHRTLEKRLGGVVNTSNEQPPHPTEYNLEPHNTNDKTGDSETREKQSENKEMAEPAEASLSEAIEKLEISGAGEEHEDEDVAKFGDLKITKLEEKQAPKKKKKKRNKPKNV